MSGRGGGRAGTPAWRSQTWPARIFAIGAWLFVACLIMQFLLVGLRAFQVEGWTELHRSVPYVYGWLAPILVLLSWFAPQPRRSRTLAVALLVAFAVETYLPTFAPALPALGAVHAVFALVVMWLAVALARSALVDVTDSRTTRDGGWMTTGRGDRDDRRVFLTVPEVSVMRLLRLVFAALAWIYLALVALQVFLAGAGVFGAAGFDLHRNVGYLVAFYAPLILLVVAVVARGRQLVGYSAVLLVLGVVQSILPWLRVDAPFLAALHPVNALLMAWLALVLARGATALARASERRSDAPASQLA